MKNMIISFLLMLISVTLFAQNKKYYRYDNIMSGINDNIASDLDTYSHSFSHDLKRDASLDFRAKTRNSYFLDVIEQTSASGESFSVMVDSIPHGKIGHTQQFGKPGYFKSPLNTTYPELFAELPNLGLKVKGEIMYQVIWSCELTAKQTSHSALIQRATDDIKKAYGVDKLSEKVVNEYQNSKSHNTIIKEKGNGSFGTSTMVIITEERLPNGKWYYEVMIRNLVIFTEQLN